MPNVIQILRSSTPGSVPTAKQPGEPFVNFADNSFGVFDTTAVSLIPIRFFSTLAAYVPNDHVVETATGSLWKCIAATGPGPFVAADWTELGAAGAPPAETDPLALHLTGGTMTGPIVLAADPAAALEPVTLQYLESLLGPVPGPYLPLAAGPLSPLTGPLHLYGTPPVAPEEATDKAYVDAGDTLLQSQIDVLASNLLFSGSIAVVTDTTSPTAESGIAAGPLPVADATNANKYFIVTDGGTALAGNIPAGDYNIADWLVSDGTQWVYLPIGLGVAATIIAPGVPLSPDINGWGTVQGAVQGLEDAKVDLAGDTMTGVLTLAADPVGPLEPVTLQYLENYVVDAGTY
jgi:hypothetical protein